tara:strand:+ start:221 stop:931 length:711 start_codon:yes stop_codon:yes gene_type:complete
MAYKCNKPALKMLSPIFQKMGKNHCSEGPLSMGSPLSHVNTTGSTNHSHNGKKHPEGYVGKPDPVYKKGEISDIDPKYLKPKTMGMEGVIGVMGGAASNIYTAGKFLLKNGLSPDLPQDEVKNERYKEKMKNLEDMQFEIPPKSQTITSNNSIHEDNVLSMRSPLSKTAPGKKFSVKDGNRTVSYGEKGYTIGKCGSEKAHNYCARSSGIKECADPPCANALSRKKWKCVGKRSVC